MNTRIVDSRPVPSSVGQPVKNRYKNVWLTSHQIDLLGHIHNTVLDAYQFSELTEGFLNRATEGHKIRFFDWLEQLLVLKNERLFTEMCHAVIWCFRKGLFVTQQTTYQFNSCKMYIEQLAQCKQDRANKLYGKHLFICICILAERPDFQKKSLPLVFQKYHKHYIPCAEYWFNYLFLEEGEHNFLGKHLPHLTNYEVNIMTSLLEQASLRRTLKETHSISKKENYVLLQNQIDLTGFTNHVLDRYIVGARLVKGSTEITYLVNLLLRHSNTFRYHLDVFVADISFWKSVVNFFSRFREEIALDEISECVDYFEYQRYQSVPPKIYSLKGRTLRSVERAVDEWHYGDNYFATKERLESTWAGLGLPLFSKMIHEQQFTISEITDGKTLLQESKTMLHCVFSYLEPCVNGFTHVFSLKMKLKNQVKYIATIEVRNKRLVQVCGKRNRPIQSMYSNLIETWRTQNNLEPILL